MLTMQEEETHLQPAQRLKSAAEPSGQSVIEFVSNVFDVVPSSIMSQKSRMSPTTGIENILNPARGDRRVGEMSMELIRCEGCAVIHESTLPVCPGCGRCPCCGELRVSRKELRLQAACPGCNVPYCGGCGRCHVCGVLRFAEMEAHSCGFPTDPQTVQSVEKNFGIRERSRGCLTTLSLCAFTLMSVFWLSGIIEVFWVSCSCCFAR